MYVKLLQSCLTLCDCSPPGSSVHGIFQARTTEWVAMPSSRGSSWPRGWTCISHVSWIDRLVLYHCATWGTHALVELGSITVPSNSRSFCLEILQSGFKGEWGCLCGSGEPACPGLMPWWGNLAETWCRLHPIEPWHEWSHLRELWHGWGHCHSTDSNFEGDIAIPVGLEGR